MSEPSEAFRVAVDSLLLEEGGYTQGLTDDPGGETHWGISRKSYPDLDIKHLTRDEAVAIYYRDFWPAIDGDALPPKLALVLLDVAVNMGPDKPVRILQAVLGLPQDGQVGPLTARAAWQYADARKLLLLFAAATQVHYAELHNWPSFRHDWTRRHYRVFTRALLYGTPVDL